MEWHEGAAVQEKGSQKPLNSQLSLWFFAWTSQWENISKMLISIALLMAIQMI